MLTGPSGIWFAPSLNDSICAPTTRFARRVTDPLTPPSAGGRRSESGMRTPWPSMITSKSVSIGKPLMSAPRGRSTPEKSDVPLRPLRRRCSSSFASGMVPRPGPSRAMVTRPDVSRVRLPG